MTIAPSCSEHNPLVDSVQNDLLQNDLFLSSFSDVFYVPRNQNGWTDFKFRFPKEYLNIFRFSSKKLSFSVTFLSNHCGSKLSFFPMRACNNVQKLPQYYCACCSGSFLKSFDPEIRLFGFWVRSSNHSHKQIILQ